MDLSAQYALPMWRRTILRSEHQAPDHLEVIGRGAVRIDIGPITLHVIASDEGVIVTPAPLGESPEAFDPTRSDRLQADFIKYRELLRESIDARTYDADDLTGDGDG
jgi:hypothetical protein